MINIEFLQAEAVKCTDLNRLCDLTIELSKLIRECHIEKAQAKSDYDLAVANGNLSVYHSILSTINIRRTEVSEQEKANRNEQQRINYNFRMAAKDILTHETYRKIIDIATISRKDAANDVRKLSKNRLNE